MISIKIAGKFVETSPDLSIPFELNNDLFNIDDTLPRQFTYQITLPPTPKNHIVFKWLKSVNSTTEWSERYDAEIIDTGLDIIAKCKVGKVSSKGYEVTFFVGKASFKEASEKLMNTLKLDGVRKIIDPYTNQDDIMAQMLVIANNPEDYDFLFAPMYHSNFYQGNSNDQNSGISGFLIINTYNNISNSFNAGVFQKNWIEGTSPKPTVHEETTYIPFFKVKYLIHQIFSENNYIVTDDFFNTVEKSLMYIYNNFCLDKQETTTGGLLGPIQTTVCDNEITPGNHMPNNTISEFLNSICRLFNIHQDFSLVGQRVRLINREDIYNDLSEDDWTYKQNGQLEQTAPYRNQYGFKAAEDNADGYHVDVMIPGKRLEKDNYTNRQIIESLLSWPFEGTPFVDVNDPARSLILASINQPGNSPLFPDNGTENPFVGKLMFYRGMQPDSLSNNYPLLTPSNKNYAGATIGDLVMDWSDPTYGIYEKFFKNWVKFISNSRLVTMPLQLTIEDICNLDLTKRKRIDTAVYFIKKLSFNLTHKGISDAKAELYKI